MAKEITGRQLAILMSLSIFSLKALTLPSLMFKINDRDSFYSFLLILFIDLFTLLIVLYFMHYKKSINMYDTFAKNMGKIVAKTIYLLIFFIYFFKMQLVIGETFTYFRETIFKDATLFLYLLILLGMIISIILFDIRAFSRTCEFYYYIIVAGIVFSIFMALLSGKVTMELFPLKYDFSLVISSGFDKLAWFGDYFFVLILLDKIKIDKKTNKNILIYVIFTLIILIVFYAVFYNIYGITIPGHRNAMNDLVAFTKKTSGVDFVDWIPIFTLMFAVTLVCGIYTFCLKEAYMKVTADYNSKRALFVIMLTLLISIYGYFNNNGVVISFSTKILKYFAMVVFYLIPLAFFLLSYLQDKKVRKKEVTYEKYFS